MRLCYLILTVFFTFLARAQTVSNGNFGSGAVGWSCNPETNPENVYGGSGSNSTAEVDAAAGLCQTISGFIIGNVYQLSITYSRRTGGCPGPNPAGANITISGGSLSASISSTVSSFTWQTSIFTFTAMQASLTLDIAANFGGTTCGLIIDDVIISPYTPLPIELLYFTALANENDVLLEWATASQLNNDYFSIERSADAVNWQVIETVKGDGTATGLRQYRTVDLKPLENISYYRLKQTDYNKEGSYSLIVSVDRGNYNYICYPNPATTEFYIRTTGKINSVIFISSTGSEIQGAYSEMDSGIRIDASTLEKGIYILKLKISQKEIKQKIVIEHGN